MSESRIVVETGDRDTIDPYVAEMLYEEHIAHNVDVRGGTASSLEWPAWDELLPAAVEHWTSMAVAARLASAAVQSRRIVDPGNLPAEVIEAAKMAAFEAGEQVAVARASGQRVSLTEANNLKVQAALSAAFRTLGETSTDSLACMDERYEEGTE